MSIRNLATGVLLAASLGWASSARAITTSDIAQAHPIVFGDMTTFNFRILHQVNPAIPVPATPTGNTSTLIRMYTNGNTHNPTGTTDAIVFAPGNVALYPDDVAGFSATTRADFWYGLEFSGHPTSTVSSVLTADDVLAFLHSISGPTVSNPLFGFDQNQEVSDPDIYLRARLILVKPSVSLLGLSSAAATSAVNTALGGGDAVEFKLIDDAPLPNGPDALPGGAGYVYLPGNYDPDFDADPLSPFDPVSNNGAGNNADWGGYIDGLDLNNYPGYAFLVELEAKDNNNGKEEAYILGGLNGRIAPPPIPEPLTTTLGLLSLGGLALASRRRRV
jgi:hypothetical protein